MAYMKDSTGKRLDAFEVADAKKVKSITGTSSQLISVLRRERQDASIVLSGDSTGNETVEWFYLLITWLAPLFPKWTVIYRLWNHTTQGYDAPVTLQTGTGTRTLSVYNASHPGAGHNYAFENSNTTRFNAIFPVAPTTVIASYGYNAGTSTYRAEMTEFARWVQGSFPATEMIFVSQPPKSTPDPDSANSLLRSADVRSVALQQGYGLIDAAQVFLDYGNFDTLINGDYVHPNAQGMALWAAEAKRIFDPETPAVRPRIAGPSIERIFVNASQFSPVVGAPALAPSAAGIPKWDFDPATSEAVAAVVDIPPTWGSANVWLYWSTPGGSTSAVVWYVDYQQLTNVMAGVVTSGVPAGFTTGGKQTLNSQSGAGGTRVQTMFTATRFSAGRPLVFRIRRDAVDAADTYASDAWAYGLMIERAS